MANSIEIIVLLQMKVGRAAKFEVVAGYPVNRKTNTARIAVTIHDSGKPRAWIGGSVRTRLVSGRIGGNKLVAGRTHKATLDLPPSLLVRVPRKIVAEARGEAMRKATIVEVWNCIV